MAIASVREFDVGDDRSTTNYDAIDEKLREREAPDGLILHTAGFTDDGTFRIFEVWESAEQQDAYVEQVLGPLFEEGPADPSRSGPPDREYTYELHNLAPR